MTDEQSKEQLGSGMHDRDILLEARKKAEQEAKAIKKRFTPGYEKLAVAEETASNGDQRRTTPPPTGQWIGALDGKGSISLDTSNVQLYERTNVGGLTPLWVLKIGSFSAANNDNAFIAAVANATRIAKDAIDAGTHSKLIIDLRDNGGEMCVQ